MGAAVAAALMWILAAGSAQAAQWANVFDGGGVQSATLFSASPTADRGYVVAGVTYQFGVAGDVWVMKLNARGEAEWQKAYGGNSEDRAAVVQPTPDGGYIVAGTTYSTGTGTSDAMVLKLDASGNVVWQKTYGGAANDTASSIELTPDGGFVVAGTTYSFCPNVCAWVLKLDGAGNVVWQRAYGSVGGGGQIRPTADGGYVLVGIAVVGVGNQDVWVAKLDAAGDVTWQRTYGGTNWDEGKDIRPTPDGGYVVAANTASFSGTITPVPWILKLDAVGGISWQKALRHVPANTISVTSLGLSPDGGFVVAGYRGSGNADAWIAGLDGAGRLAWQRRYGNLAVSGFGAAAYAVVPVDDGGYFAAGAADMNGAVLKVDADGAIPGCALMAASALIAVDTFAVTATSAGAPFATSTVPANGTMTVTDTVAPQRQSCYFAPLAPVPALAPGAVFVISVLVAAFGVSAARALHRRPTDTRAACTWAFSTRSDARRRQAPNG